MESGNGSHAGDQAEADDGRGSASKASGESIHLRVMVRGDVPDGIRLKQSASWNQTYADWRRFLALDPGRCFVATTGAQIVGTVTTCLFGTVAWIGMMLVDPAFRRQGIATRLMQHALAQLETVGIVRARLDATAMGIQLYERFGFRPQLRIIRYGGDLAAWHKERGAATVRSFCWGDWQALRQLDCAVAKVDRTKLLKRLLLQRGGHARLLWRSGRLQGFLLDRPGSYATQIGPFVARDETAGRTLLVDARTRMRRGVVVIDIPADNLPARAAAEEAGLVAQREFVRMSRGVPCQESVSDLWGGSGPEKG